MSKKVEVFKKEGKYISFPGTRDNDKIEEAVIVEKDVEEFAKPFDPLKDKVEKVKEYNKKISTDFSQFENINLIGQKVLFRPFKVSPLNKSGFERLFVANTVDEDTGRKKTVNLDFAVQYRGVICKVSDDCSDKFKERIKVGDVVDINTIAWQQHSYYLNRDVFQEVEEPFTFWLPETHIQAKLENYNVQ